MTTNAESLPLSTIGAILERECRRIFGEVVREECEKLLSARPQDSLTLTSSTVGSRASTPGVDPEFTDAEAGRLLGLCADRVAKLRRSGRIGFYRYPGRVTIGASHVRKYQEDIEVKPRRNLKAAAS